jgi:CarD family transcriptional regulator
LFRVGDKVFYPMHGAGIIKQIEQKEILGTRKNYYVLQFPLSQMTVMLPTENATKVGLREVADPLSVLEVLTFLKHRENTPIDNWNQRFRENTSALKSGDIHSLARVVKSLVLRNRDKGLSTNEKKMLEEARQCLTSEIALVNDVLPDQANRVIEEAIGQ